MNWFLGFCVGAALLLIGCSDKAEKPAGTAGGTTNAHSPAEASGGYLGALGQGQQNAIKTADTTSLDQAIQLFSVDHGRYPKDLNELLQDRYIQRLPAPPNGMKIVYDATAGKVSIVKQ